MSHDVCHNAEGLRVYRISYVVCLINAILHIAYCILHIAYRVWRMAYGVWRTRQRRQACTYLPHCTRNAQTGPGQHLLFYLACSIVEICSRKDGEHRPSMATKDEIGKKLTGHFRSLYTQNIHRTQDT
jgi:hypothetical protein